jgi:hypothetical protein
MDDIIKKTSDINAGLGIEIKNEQILSTVIKDDALRI